VRRGGQLEAAFVLHRRAFRETSALVELFTREHGRVGLVARGVRGKRARNAGVLQPFSRLSVSWSAQGELGTLTGVEAAGPVRGLSGRRLASGFYLNELILRLTRREDPLPELFDRYAETLAALAGGAGEAPVLRLFERDLLAALGYGLQLETDTTGARVTDDRHYRYELEHGPVPVGGAQPGMLHLSGASLLALASGHFGDADTEREALRLTRAALRLYLGDRPLKSRELLTRS
jgi:DNA repair protein RecO (recombination protein O)